MNAVRYRDTFDWKIEGAEFEAFKVLPTGEKKESEEFTIGPNVNWYLRCYPNGDTQDAKDNVMLSLVMSSFPAHFTRIVVFFQLHCVESSSSFSSIKAFTSVDEKVEWFRSVFAAPELRQMPESVTRLRFQCTLTILSIESAENPLYGHELQWDLRRKSRFVVDWKLTGEMLDKFKTASHGKFISDNSVQNGMWALQCAPNGFRNGDEGSVRLFIQLCALPTGVRSIHITRTLQCILPEGRTLERGQKEKEAQSPWGYPSTTTKMRQNSGWGKNVLQRAECLELCEIHFRAVINVFAYTVDDGTKVTLSLPNADADEHKQHVQCGTKRKRSASPPPTTPAPAVAAAAATRSAAAKAMSAAGGDEEQKVSETVSTGGASAAAAPLRESVEENKSEEVVVKPPKKKQKTEVKPKVPAASAAAAVSAAVVPVRAAVRAEHDEKGALSEDDEVDDVKRIEMDNRYQGEYEWRISNDLLSKFKTAKYRATWQSPEFTVAGYKWCIECYPAGHNTKDKGKNCVLFLTMLSHLNDAAKTTLTVCWTLFCRPSGASYTSVSDFSDDKNSFGFCGGVLSQTELQSLQNSFAARVVLGCRVSVLRKVNVVSGSKTQKTYEQIYPLQVKDDDADGISTDGASEVNACFSRQCRFEWRIEGDLMQQFKDAYNGKCFESPTFNGNMWSLRCAPNGDNAADAGQVDLVLQLNAFPKNVSKMKVSFKFKCKETKSRALIVHNFNTAKSAAGWKEKLNKTDIEHLDALTFTVLVEIETFYDPCSKVIKGL